MTMDEIDQKPPTPLSHVGGPNLHSPPLSTPLGYVAPSDPHAPSSVSSSNCFGEIWAVRERCGCSRGQIGAGWIVLPCRVHEAAVLGELGKGAT